MFGSTFYHGSIRRYIILFGTLMNEIFIKRYKADGTLDKLIKVPITYGPKDKVIARVNADPNLNKPFAIVLPYMSFELKSITYDADRHLQTTGRSPFLNLNNKNVANYMYNPVPYNLNFELNVMVKNAEDGSKILEQILPYFTPDWTATIRIIDDPEILIDVPTLIGQPSSQDTYDNGGLGDRRVLTWTIPFTMKGTIYGPVRKSKIIKEARINVGYNAKDRDTLDQVGIYETIVTVPGLTVDGKPTSNVSESVAYSEIDWTDDYGYASYIERE
jgi:hypothetical protein